MKYKLIIIPLVVIPIIIYRIFGTRYGAWEVNSTQTMPYISGNTLAIEKTRKVRTFSNSFSANGFGYESIWTDGKKIKIRSCEASTDVENYIWNTEIYKTMNRSREKFWFKDKLRERVIPNHKIVVVSVNPTVAIMVPIKYEISENGHHEWITEGWGSELGCVFLESWTVHKGTRFPYRDDIKWFECSSTNLPKELTGNKIELPNATLRFVKENDYMMVYRDR